MQNVAGLLGLRAVWATALATLWLALSILTSCGHANDGEIMITVTDLKNQPVTSANVTIINQRTNTSIAAQPDRTGVYRTPALRPGTYTIAVQKEGFRPELKANVQADGTATVHIAMRLSGVGSPPDANGT